MVVTSVVNDCNFHLEKLDSVFRAVSGFPKVDSDHRCSTVDGAYDLMVTFTYVCLYMWA
jgi:hypothetical protein